MSDVVIGRSANRNKSELGPSRYFVSFPITNGIMRKLYRPWNDVTPLPVNSRTLFTMSG